MSSKPGSTMNALPIESKLWREGLKHRIQMESAILRALIRWGMAESAADVSRSLEEHFGSALEAQVDASPVPIAPPAVHDRAFVRELLREAYLRTREIPRRGVIQARLHDSLLTGFEELSLEIVQCYEGFLFRSERNAQRGKAA